MPTHRLTFFWIKPTLTRINNMPQKIKNEANLKNLKSFKIVSTYLLHRLIFAINNFFYKPRSCL